MRTLAHALVETRYLQQGKTTRIVVLPLRESGLPDHLVDAAQPVPLDLLSGRPVNLELDEHGLVADLCFSGPPVRCRFPWESVIAVQSSSGSMVQTLVVTIATVMEDESLRPATEQHLVSMTIDEAGGDRFLSLQDERPMKVLDGGGRETTANRPRRRPRLEVVGTASRQRLEEERRDE